MPGQGRVRILGKLIHYTCIGAAMKNCFMSTFISAANWAARTPRAQAMVIVKREAATRARQLITSWTNTILPPVAAQRRKQKPEK